ncbi:YdeI/OmpD-associated family protein [Cellulomonas triticagri]|uniref:Uncharacterized protein n=1 Tax=Cellulomonas triticagri TaxID=2483352 RepID=A0A3M2ITS9_9CELL|nr:hypothetical protein [Cellulomonas triticagri]RMI03311.1 hypothetical protein EBM89_19885 [Cellulomonas triticagri]
MGHLTHEGLAVVEFRDAAELDAWLGSADRSDVPVWVRLRRTRSAVPSVTFHELLKAGIAHGWSESTRHGYDADSYLQRFGPRRTRGTTKTRNREIADRLIREGRMTPAGMRALGRT